jgi:uncharacterized protein (TIGR00369 family)
MFAQRRLPQPMLGKTDRAPPFSVVAKPLGRVVAQVRRTDRASFAQEPRRNLWRASFRAFKLAPRSRRDKGMSATGLERAAAIFARFPTPPCATTLGWQLLDADPEEGIVRIGFEGRDEFCNPAGFVQGGFLAAMLDDVMGPAVLVRSDGAFFTPTIGLNVTFLAPARPGRLTGEGRIVHLGKTIAFLEGSLFDRDAALVARATASARLMPTNRL